jgi:hypothetical protein
MFIDGNGHQVPIYNLKNGQEIAYTGTAGVIATALTTGCKLIAAWTSTDAYVNIGNGVTDATAAHMHFPAGVIVFVPVPAAASKVAAKQVASGGILHVMECW